MELRDLKSMTVLFDLGSYGRAASALGVDVSTLSRRVSNLEDELGVLLFERTRAGVRLTASGQEIIRLARRVIGDLEGIRESAAHAGLGQKGHLRLASQTAVVGPWMREALKDYRATHPNIGIQMSESSDHEILSGLRERRFDAAILFTPTLTSSVGSHELWTERLVLAVSKAHRLSSADRVHWADVRSETMLVRGWSDSQSFREVEAALIGPSARFRSHQAGCLALLSLVAIGEGAMITLESHRELAVPGVTFLDIEEPNAWISVALAWDADVEDPIAGSFVAFMRDRRAHGSLSHPLT